MPRFLCLAVLLSGCAAAFGISTPPATFPRPCGRGARRGLENAFTLEQVGWRSHGTRVAAAREQVGKRESDHGEGPDEPKLATGGARAVRSVRQAQRA